MPLPRKPQDSQNSHSSQAPQYWLFKTEPSTYSFQSLQKDGVTLWNGVRNLQARNFLRETRPGDWVLIYHSGEERSVVGIAQVSDHPVPELDPARPGDWVQVELVPVLALSPSVSLAQIKADKTLAALPLIRHTRLSCMKISQAEFERIRQLGQTTRPDSKKPTTAEAQKGT